MSKPGLLSVTRGLHEGIAHRVHVGTSHRARDLIARGSTAPDLARSTSQLSASSGSSMPSQPSFVDPFSPEWPSCRQILRLGLPCTKSTMRFQACICAFAVHAGAARRDATLRRDAGHLGEYQTCAAQCTRAEVHEMKIVRHAVLRAVSRHRRHHDAVGKRHIAQLERQEHRRDRPVRRVAHRHARQASPPFLPASARSRRRRFSWLIRWLRVSRL